MGDDDSSSDDDFLLFKWDAQADEDDAESHQECPLTDAGADLSEVLSRLASMDETGHASCGLRSVMDRVGAPFLSGGGDGSARKRCIVCNVIDLHRRNDAVKHHAGTMAQCRGAGGDALREAGAIGAVLDTLWRLTEGLEGECDNGPATSQRVLLPDVSPEATNDESEMHFILDSLCANHLPLRNSSNQNFNFEVLNELDFAVLDLATTCLGSLRDLSCGSALNRAAVLEWKPPTQCSMRIGNGVHLLTAYIKRYDRCSWEDILSLKQHGPSIDENGCKGLATDRGKRELRLLTNALGVVRNTSHSTPDVCQEFFVRGLVDPLIWRIMPCGDGSATPSTSLPDASCPWREACFRAASSLINLAEKCHAVASQLGSSRQLIYLLLETWGGAGAITIDNTKANGASARGLPLLHLGLAAILNAAADGALEGGLDDVMSQVLEKEVLRKRAAQRREEERKAKLQAK